LKGANNVPTTYVLNKVGLKFNLETKTRSANSVYVAIAGEAKKSRLGASKKLCATQKGKYL